MIAQLDLGVLRHLEITPSVFKVDIPEDRDVEYIPACYVPSQFNTQTDIRFQNYVDNLSFFCKLEVQTDRKARIPVRVRLGTVQYVDMLEQKYQGFEWINGDRRGHGLLPVFQR